MNILTQIVPLYEIAVFAFLAGAALTAILFHRTIEFKYHDMSLRIEGQNSPPPSLPQAE